VRTDYFETSNLRDPDQVTSDRSFSAITQRSEGVNHNGSLKQRVEQLEKEMIVEALQAANGNMAAAAKQLDITPRIARYKIKKLGIDHRSFYKSP
jgi:transcriptional regulator with GAF, ATPase, and Fis domain